MTTACLKPPQTEAIFRSMWLLRRCFVKHREVRHPCSSVLLIMANMETVNRTEGREIWAPHVSLRARALFQRHQNPYLAHESTLGILRPGTIACRELLKRGYALVRCRMSCSRLLIPGQLWACFRPFQTHNNKVPEQCTQKIMHSNCYR